jgi:predicted  nucleic acid-binding Zn-ribbon protein
MSRETQRQGSPVGDSKSESSTGNDTELDRLRRLVGEDEYSYTALKLELWTVRDLFIGMEAELGNLRSRCRLLDRRVQELQRELEDDSEPQTPGASATPGSALIVKARAVRARLTQL